MQTSTSKSNSCRCDKNCGCCTKGKTAQVEKREPGFIGKRPWLFVVAAFLFLFAVWGTMFTLAYQNQPEVIPMPTEAASAH